MVQHIPEFNKKLTDAGGVETNRMVEVVQDSCQFLLSKYQNPTFCNFESRKS